jgi:hypothetical protein
LGRSAKRKSLELDMSLCNEFAKLVLKLGARGSVVVKALRYKPAGRGFDSFKYNQQDAEPKRRALAREILCCY